MKKKTALIILLCFVCAAIIGVCAIAGVSKWKLHQTELQRQQILDDYSAQLSEAFDELYDIETGLIDRMAAQQQAGASDRQILIDTVDAIRTRMDQLASVEVPEELSEAQRHFTAAAQSYGTIADTVTGLLADETQNAETIRSAAIELLPDAIDACDQLKYGVEALAESGANVPDSAKLLTESLDSLIDSGIDRALATHE